MEDRETARMRKYGESKTTRIMMAAVPHVASGLELRKFQADVFLLTRMYHPMGRIVRAVMQRWIPWGSSGTRTLSLSRTVTYVWRVRVARCQGNVRDQDDASALLAVRHALTPVSHFGRNMETRNASRYHSTFYILISRYFQNFCRLILIGGPYT